MARTIKEIMNRELVSARPTTSARDVRTQLHRFAIDGMPIVDDQQRPVGAVSAKDLTHVRQDAPISDYMTSPPLVVQALAPIEQAARLLAETGYHRAIAIDADGRAVGIVSSLDVIRGLIGLPTPHPDVFPHYHENTDLPWSNPYELELSRVEVAPRAPGVLVLIHGGINMPERLVWGEAVDDLRIRLVTMLSDPDSNPPLLAYWLQRGKLRFRTTEVPHEQDRAKVLSVVLDEAVDRDASGMEGLT